MVRNERGIALVVTLLVVALLTITVVEFSYSVEVDQRMARNALNGLQASLLARSGINLGEAFLLHDDDPNVDAYAEDWGKVDELNSQLILPERMLLKVQIIDESGKFNINLTRPRNVPQWRAAQQNPNAAQQPFQSAKEALRNLLQGRGMDPQVADAVADYWDRVLEANFGPAPAAPGAENTPGRPQATATPGNPVSTGQYLPAQQFDFPSLDDASVIPGLAPSVIRRMRPVLTAIFSDQNLQPQVNANTAPREVLNAIIGDSGVVDNIISQREEAGLKSADLGPLLTGVDPARNAGKLLGVRSTYFLIRASARVNANPVTGRGGISRSASMLVLRRQNGKLPSGMPRWTLTQLDWQKEGGAALFEQKADQEFGVDDSSSRVDPGMGG